MKNEFIYHFFHKKFFKSVYYCFICTRNRKQFKKINTMNAILKSVGVIILLIGVGILAITAFADIQSNTYLGVGLLLVILGFVSHIFLNKKFE